MENYYAFTVTCQKWWRDDKYKLAYCKLNEQQQKAVMIEQLEPYIALFKALAFEKTTEGNIHCHGIIYCTQEKFVWFREYIFAALKLKSQTLDKHLSYVFEGHVLEQKSDIVSWISYLMKEQRKEDLMDIFNVTVTQMMNRRITNIFGVSEDTIPVSD